MTIASSHGCWRGTCCEPRAFGGALDQPCYVDDCTTGTSSLGGRPARARSGGSRNLHHPHVSARTVQNDSSPFRLGRGGALKQLDFRRWEAYLPSLHVRKVSSEGRKKMRTGTLRLGLLRLPLEDIRTAANIDYGTCGLRTTTSADVVPLVPVRTRPQPSLVPHSAVSPRCSPHRSAVRVSRIPQ